MCGLSVLYQIEADNRNVELTKSLSGFFFFFNDTATTEIYTLSLHDALPICSLLTHVVRRRRPVNEGPDDVQKFYRAELVPFVLRVTSDPETGKPSALFDLTRFSSWAREARPARVIFGPDRRPELITASLMLGTSVNIRMKAPG